MARRLRGVSGSVRQLLGDAGTAIFGQGEKEWAHAVSGFAAFPLHGGLDLVVDPNESTFRLHGFISAYQKPSGTC